MQRLSCNPRLLSLFRFLQHTSLSVKSIESLPVASYGTVDHCGFSSSSSSHDAGQAKRRNAAAMLRRPMGPFLKRTDGVKKILDLFAALTAWDDEETPHALYRLGVPFHCYTVSEVIRNCMHVDTALSFFNWLNTKHDFKPDSYVYNALIYRLGRVGRLKDMEAIASLSLSDGKGTLVTFTTLISAFKMAMDLDGAVRTWRHMEELGLELSPATYTAMIDLYATMKMYDEAGDCYLQMLKKKLSPSIRTCTVLIKHLVEAGKLDAAADMFDQLLKVKLRPNPVTYASLMCGYAKAGDMNAVLKLVRDFKEYGHSPLALGKSFISVLQYLVNEGKIQDAEAVMEAGWPESSTDDRREKILEFQAGLQGDAPRHVDLMRKKVDSEEEEEEEDDDEDDESPVPRPSADTSTLLNVVAFVRCLVPWSSATGKALENANLKWDCHLVWEILNRLRKTESGWKFFRWVGEQPGYRHDRYTCSMMIRLLCRDGQFARAKQLLQEARKERLNLSLRTYSTILKHCGLQKEANFALEVFDLLKESGLTPNEVCYKNLILALLKCNRYWRVATICSEMRKMGFLPDETTYSFLISGFAAAGKFSLAKRLNKQARMLGFKPNAFVYNGLIRTFYEVGRLDKAERVFKGMRGAGMMPTPQICEVMVEVFSHLGKHKEACELKDEIKARVSYSGTAKKARLDQYLHFHTIFVENLTECVKCTHSLAAG